MNAPSSPQRHNNHKALVGSNFELDFANTSKLPHKPNLLKRPRNNRVSTSHHLKTPEIKKQVFHLPPVSSHNGISIHQNPTPPQISETLI